MNQEKELRNVRSQITKYKRLGIKPLLKKYQDRESKLLGEIQKVKGLKSLVAKAVERAKDRSEEKKAVQLEYSSMASSPQHVPGKPLLKRIDPNTVDPDKKKQERTVCIKCVLGWALIIWIASKIVKNIF